MKSDYNYTATHLLEYLYCPRFTYFEYVLDISERQEKRFKVMKGRSVHESVIKTNRNYLRKSLMLLRNKTMSTYPLNQGFGESLTKFYFLGMERLHHWILNMQNIKTACS